jgi:hypothetical protein
VAAGHVEPLLAELLGETDDPQAASDACAETLAAAVLRARRRAPPPGEVGPWLRALAEPRLAELRERGAVPPEGASSGWRLSFR